MGHMAMRTVRGVRRLTNMLMAASALIAGAAIAQAPPQGAFPVAPHPPAGAPNVLVIMTDDVGFGASSTFGGPIPTPTLDMLAAQGARYSSFHTASVCASTRAALLTGRNHHAIAAGSVPEMATPYPGYNSVIPPTAASFARVLQLNGYNTAMFGKHHNTPVWEDIPGGPATHKPQGFGFDYFYGFIGAATNMTAPSLWENLNQVEPAPGARPYFLDRDLADHAVDWLRMHQTQSPDRPFLLYYAPGTLHAPVQAPADWIAKFRGKFDSGWDALRRETYERQKRLGIIPKDAELAPMAPGTPAWDSLTPDRKRLAARYMEVYAAALAYCDDQMGRLIDELKRSGQYDNTLVFYIQGDNGASVEGGPDGAFSYNNRLNGTPESFEQNLARIDQIGSAFSMPAVPIGWTRATNAPFPWNKTIASHLGGTGNGLVISWPGHVTAGKAVRFQFHDVIDVAPTIYQAAGIKLPDQVDGSQQMPLDGVSMLYSLRDPAAPSPHTEQYFETFGNMGLYKDGWLLSSKPLSGGQSLYDKADGAIVWELYDLRKDFSQVHDLAAAEPGTLQAMIARFNVIADKDNINPISRDMISRMSGIDRPMIVPRPGRYTFFNGPTRYGVSAFPDVRGRSWSVRAKIVAATGPGDGMIVTHGGRFAGWGVAVLGGHATFLYRMTDMAGGLQRITDPAKLTPGPHDILLSFKADEKKIATGGTFTLAVDGKPAASLRMDHTVPMSWFEDAEIGRDYGTPISEDYQVPFIFPGTIERVDFDTSDEGQARNDGPPGGHPGAAATDD